MKTKTFTVTISSLMLATAAALAVLPAAADEVVAIAMPVARAAVEIDRESLKIDVAAHVRSIDASLRRATVVPAVEDLKVAAADARARG
jgi:hypothetical protein